MKNLNQKMIVTTALAVLVLAAIFFVPTTKGKYANEMKLLKEWANRMAQAVVDNDYEKSYTLTHPALITALGGKEKYIESVKRTIGRDMVIEKASVGEPTSIVEVGTELQAIVPETMEIGVSAGTLIVNASLIAFSYNDRQNWYFMDTGGHSLEELRKFLPIISTELVIPPQQEPVLKNN